jgi:Fe-S-cluster-containing hydrogenase component 2/CRP-like cAMP-binding protein
VRTGGETERSKAEDQSDSPSSKEGLSKEGAPESAKQRVATAYLLSGGSVAEPGFFSRLFSGRPRALKQLEPTFIPNDGPTDIDYQTRQAPMFEGDVFGEMSCMTLAPRSATIVVDHDCYMIEFLRNIFDKVQSDAGYRKRADDIYTQRVLSTHLGRLEIFQGLTEPQLAVLRDAAHLEVVEPGTVICDEGDRSDSVYLIRSGVVQVVRGAHVGLQATHVSNWPSFCKLMLAAVEAEDDDDGDTNGSAERAPDEISAKPKKSVDVADILAAARGGAGKENPPKSPSKDAGADDDDDAPETLLAVAEPKPSGQPRRLVWDWFSPSVHAAIRSIADDRGSPDDRDLVIRAINRLVRRREFVNAEDVASLLEQPNVSEVVKSFPDGIAGAKKKWSDLDVRKAGSLVMRALFPDSFAWSSTQKGAPDILAYLSRGDCFGEMALVLDAPRQATCIAYDHPTDDSKRKPGRVELVRIDGVAFKQLLDASDTLRTTVDRMVSRRYVDIVGGELRAVGTADESLTHSKEFQDAGLAQGQNLLLIDLDRCTRCGDCVRACQNTHADGQSRLFLDGPRFDRFLIPSACRQCLNPACMIGCPVGSIQRGDNGQIEIRDWCIGCKLCADQCPYDSIQMHDIGIIAEQTVGWQFAPSSAVGDGNWQARGYRARNWAVGLAPFKWTLDLFEQLASRAPAGAWQAENASLREPICFRFPFQMSRAQHKKRAFNLHVSSSGLEARAWLNGAAIVADEPANPKRKKKPGEVQARLTQSDVRIGHNVLAVQISPLQAQPGGGDCVPKYNQSILTARLDALPQAGDLATATAGEGVDLEVEMVKRRAVVCDLCSTLSNQRPACVDQCPHEAAIRINAQFEFPSAATH